MAINRIDIHDWVELGKLIVAWSKDPASAPQDMTAMRTKLDGIALIPSRMTKLVYVQADLETMLVRLPNKPMLLETEEAFQPTHAPGAHHGYPLPHFYKDVADNKRNPPDLLQTWHSRIADYTIAQCK
jgi:hypothetical protein